MQAWTNSTQHRINTIHALHHWFLSVHLIYFQCQSLPTILLSMHYASKSPTKDYTVDMEDTTTLRLVKGFILGGNKETRGCWEMESRIDEWFR